VIRSCNRVRAFTAKRRQVHVYSVGRLKAPALRLKRRAMSNARSMQTAGHRGKVKAEGLSMAGTKGNLVASGAILRLFCQSAKIGN
jgi:hypothetical protein